MFPPRPHHPRYDELLDIDARWRGLSHDYGGQASRVGRTHAGRPIWAYEFGDRDAPTILLSSLMHGIELIGGLALFDAVVALLERGTSAHLVAMPAVNPDGVAENLARVRAGRSARRRTNGAGVDLNRNFPWVCARRPRHPFAGSRWARSPYFMGPAPFSEPETRALRDVALDVRPDVSVGLHSFGNLILYPWAYTDAPHPRSPTYRRLAAEFCDALPGERYAAKPARGLYPTVGDMDDWLDAEFGTLAFTVEVGRLGRPLRRSPFDLFGWMNPADPEPVLDNVVAGLERLVASGVDLIRGDAGARRLPDAVEAQRAPPFIRAAR